MSTDSPRTRKQHTPQVERIADLIKTGAYDDDLLKIQEALQVRRTVLEQGVLDLVKQVFGPEAEIVSPREQPAPQHRPRPTPRSPSGNAFIAKAEEGNGGAPVEESSGEEVVKDALSDLDAVERRMADDEAQVGREGGGAIISGLSSQDIAD